MGQSLLGFQCDVYLLSELRVGHHDLFDLRSTLRLIFRMILWSRIPREILEFLVQKVLGDSDRFKVTVADAKLTWIDVKG